MGSIRSTSVLVWSVTISVLVTVASVLGLGDPAVYAQETESWAVQGRGQDVGNLLAVVVLLVSGLAYARGSHRAGLVWLGTLMYLVYAYLVYSMAVHFNQLFLVYVAVLGLSSWAIMWSVDRLRADDAHRGPASRDRVPGWTSISIGVLFGLLWLSELVPATLTGETPASVVEAGLWVNPIHVIDLAVVLPAFVAAGCLAVSGRASGRFFVGPLLVFSVLMGTSIVAAMVLMTVAGFGGTLPPLVMVSLVVLASLVAARRHLRPRPARVRPGSSRGARRRVA